MTDEELLDAARNVRDQAHCPYSGFSVGAALIDENGHVHVGCNVENAAYSNVSCAEAGAISAMVPCGGCRQRIHEFSDANTRVIVKDDDDTWHSYTMAELLPSSFHL
jgi:cytidine deaminase